MLISKKKQRGFSMMEVLVSLLVIGVGLLGLSGLQIASVKGTNNAHSRNVATNLAMELSERMRANPNAIDAGFYENDIDCTINEPSQCKTAAFCSPEQVARIDVQEVMCGVKKNGKREGGAANLLPNSTLLVDHNSDCDSNINNNNETSITIGWSQMVLDADQDADATSTISICVIP